MRNNSLFMQRRSALVNIIKEQYPEINNWKIILFGGFEGGPLPFRQESSFYYLTGITEPGVALTIDHEEKTTLYIPHTGGLRKIWIADTLENTVECAQKIGIDKVTFLGKQIKGYELQPYFDYGDYQEIIIAIEKIIKQKGTIFTLQPADGGSYIWQRHILDRLKQWISDLSLCIKDISQIVAQLRRIKNNDEIKSLYEAINITCIAQDAAASIIAPGINESEVSAAINFCFTREFSTQAFSSIIGSGPNAAILHYTQNNRVMEKEDLVVIDIGATSSYYCADITRTFPVSGAFTERQKELYDIVLDTQAHVANLARPGMWLSNKDRPEESLHHSAIDFLKAKGYDRYFPHGIGHFLGLDVHDVGDSSIPLQVGDVITIEPGIYIPEENVGIRIEDDYWIVADGAICLSEDLAKTSDDIEDWMKSRETND